MDSIKFFANLGKSATEALAMIRQVFGEESTSCTRNVQNHRDRKKGGTDEDKSQEHSHNFSLTSRELFSKNSSWQTKQPIPHTTVTFYGDCMKKC
jgi:hypothetical protein